MPKYKIVWEDKPVDVSRLCISSRLFGNNLFTLQITVDALFLKYMPHYYYGDNIAQINELKTNIV